MEGFEIADLLKKWNLDHLVEKFEEENINIKTLPIMEQHHIKKMFSTLRTGDQAVFEYKLKEWKKSLACEKTVDSPESNNNIILNNLIKRPMLSISEILSSTKCGLSILKYYAKYNMLQEEHRTLLINTITKYIDVNGYECSLSDCAELEKQICKLFPTENLTFYTNGKRGKIYSKLANLKRIAKDVFKETETSFKETLEFQPTENYNIYLQMLRSDNITADDFDLYWRKCAGYRFKQISDTKSTKDVFDMWPEYTNLSASKLILIDFDLKYPNAKIFSDKWSQVANKISSMIKTKCGCSSLIKEIEKAESTNEEAKALTLLWHSHKLVPPQQSFKKTPSGEKIRKRYSVADSQESFLLLAETEEVLETKLKLLQLQGRNIQPKLLLIGDFTNIKKIFVYLDNLRFPCLTILEAVDLLFKCFFVFNLEFPSESELFFNFIQSVFYDLPTTKKFTKVSAIKHEIYAN